MYPDASAYGSWTTTTSYQYPSVMTSGPSMDLNNNWSYTSPDDDDISMFCSSSTDATSWSSQATNWTPSVNPSSTHSYPSMTLSSAGYSTSGPYQMPTSAYSQSMATATNVAGFPPPITRMAYPSTSSPSDYEPSDGGSSSSKHKSSSKSGPKRSEPKRRTTKKDVPSSSTRRKSGKSSAITTPTHEQIVYDTQLLAQIGPIPSNPLTGGCVPGSYFPTAEQIGREAWRVCKSEALEMSNRRKLLEHQRTVLERETENLQFKVGLMREAISKEQRELEEAVTRAERLK